MRHHARSRVVTDKATVVGNETFGPAVSWETTPGDYDGYRGHPVAEPVLPRIEGRGQRVLPRQGLVSESAEQHFPFDALIRLVRVMRQ